MDAASLRACTRRFSRRPFEACVASLTVRQESPSPELVSLSEWYRGLNDEDAERVRSVIRLSADQAVFGFLAVLDGVRAIDNEHTELTLHAAGNLVNGDGELHDEFRVLRTSPTRGSTDPPRAPTEAMTGRRVSARRERRFGARAQVRVCVLAPNLRPQRAGREPALVRRLGRRRPATP